MIEHMHIDPAGTVRPMTDEEQESAARARSERLMQSHLDYIADLREAAPTWVDMADDAHEATYNIEACEVLAETAPDDAYLRGYWYGRAQALRELQAITGTGRT